jgi:hypothetical protein
MRFNELKIMQRCPCLQWKLFMEVCFGECATVVMMRLIAKSLDGDADLM